MKTIIKATLTIILISMFVSSCTSKKQNCDAYGVISKAENPKADVVIFANDKLIVEKES